MSKLPEVQTGDLAWPSVSAAWGGVLHVSASTDAHTVDAFEIPTLKGHRSKGCQDRTLLTCDVAFS